MSGQTLTHCGKYLDQNQEADFHLELVQSAKWRSEKGKKGKRGQIKRKKIVLYLPIQTMREVWKNIYWGEWEWRKHVTQPLPNKREKNCIHQFIAKPNKS